MKLKQLLFLVLMALPFFSFSQTFEGGMNIGINGSQIDGDFLKGYKKLNFCFGVYAWRPINDNQGWQIGLQYSGKGSRNGALQGQVITGGQVNNLRKLSLHYLEVPILFTSSQLSNVDFIGGVSLNYLFRQNIQSFDLNPLALDVRNFEPSLRIGIIYKLKNEALIETAFNYSLFSIATGPAYFPSLSAIQRRGLFNNSISITWRKNFVKKKK